VGLLDVALKKAIDLGWIDGPRVVPAGHAITPTGGHLDPTMFQAFAPHIMPQTVEEGIANGVSEVRKAVRYQIKYGAKVIKVCASGGVMSFTPVRPAPSSTPTRSCGPSSTRRTGPGCKVAAHAHGDAGHPGRHRAGIDCIEHGSLMTDETLDRFIELGAVPGADHLPGRRDGRVAGGARAPGQGGRGVPPGQGDHRKAIARGARIACGTDAPAIPTARTPRSFWPWSTGA
jgi:imidazolonepropionase-like amidohydrolase